MSQLDVIGWREWVYLPRFSESPPLKTKVDTGARSSALDATQIELVELPSTAPETQYTVKFRLQFKRQRDTHFKDCELPAVLTKIVRSSSGEEQIRPFVEIPIQLGTHSWIVQASLTDRSNMVNRMLLGRRALERRFLVDSNRKFVFGQPAK